LVPSEVGTFRMLGILLIAALVGTVFPLTLFPEGSIVLGSCAVLLVVRIFGTGWGLVAATLAGICALAVWQHPFPLLVMAAEAIIFGMLLRRGMTNIILADGIFWLFFGLPFLWIFYDTTLHANGLQILTVLIRSGLNGIGNAALATLAFHLLIERHYERRSPPFLWESHFNLIVSAFLLPSVLVILLNTLGLHEAVLFSRGSRFTEQTENLYSDLEDKTACITNSLKGALLLVSSNRSHVSDNFRHRIESLRRNSPQLLQLFILDSAGKVVTSTGVLSQTATERVITDSDIDILRQEGQPLVTEPKKAFGTDFHFTWYLPLTDSGGFAGAVGGIIDASPISDLIETYRQPGTIAFTLVDRLGNVVASPHGEQTLPENYFRNGNSARKFFENRTFIWDSTARQLSSIPLWRYFFSSSLPPDDSLPWRIAAEIPREAFLAHLQHVVGSWLALMLAPALLAIGILPLMLRRFTAPLAQLAEATGDLPQKVIRGEEIPWPNGASEVSILADNYKAMAAALDASVKEAESLRESSEEAFDRVLTEKRWEIFSASRKLEQEIGKRRRIQELLENIEAAENKYRFLVERTLVGVFIVQGDSFSYVNPRFAEIFGYSPEDILREGNVLNFIEQEDRAFVAGNFRRQLSGEANNLQYEFRGRRKDGSVVYVEALNGLGTYNGQNAVLGTLIDITERKKAEEKVMHMAFHDPLTGLPNRMLFNDRAEQAIAMTRREHEVLALLFIDLDRFKAINDTLGHAAGDSLLIEVAERLRECVRESDTVSRFGGDEFNLLLTQVRSESDAELVAHKILRALRLPFHIEGHELHGTASIGIALFPRDGSDVQTLIKNADTALYRAKDLGRNNFQIFTPSMNAKALERMELENSLHKVIERRELRVYYQAQVSLNTGRIVGTEALLRWQHSSGEMISPGTFIPLAEEIGLIFPIGEWMMRAACRQAKDWQKNGLEPLRLGINVSAHQFQDREFMDVLSRILEESRFEPKWLNVEITESVVIHDVRETIQKLRQLHAVGITVAIDDFGVGYSSLSYLKDFPIDQLKMDRTFVQNLPHSGNDAKIAGHIVDMAHSLGLSVIAEGVETRQQLQFLKSIGCDEVQGYLLSRPIPAEDFGRLLQIATPYPFIAGCLEPEIDDISANVPRCERPFQASPLQGWPDCVTDFVSPGAEVPRK